MSRFINPYTDFGFKKLFGEEANKDLLMDFLNQLLPEKHQIYSLTFKNTEKLPRFVEERKAFFDIHCVSRTGEHFIVEMQKAKMDFFKDRALYYTTYPIQEQAKKGVWNFELSAIYFIAILDFIHDEPSENMKFRRNVCLKDEDNEVFYDKLHFCFLQMPLFDKKEHELTDKFEKWVYFLKNLANLEVIPEILNEPVFQKAFESAEVAKLKPRQAKQYQQSLINYWSNFAVVETAHREGKEEGLVEGEAIGLAKGLAEGELKAKLATAEKLKQLGMSLEMIMQATGLSADELNK